MFERFVKTYTDRTYKHTTMVRHRGTVVALAMADNRQIFYCVLDLNNNSIAGSADVDFWPEHPRALQFTSEVAQVGFGILDQTRLPLVKKGGQPVEPGTTVRADEIDPFLSSTGSLSADVPFTALSDGDFIFVFRQSQRATLLVDRFQLVGAELLPKVEVRYQRSRSKFRPRDRKDSLGAKDLEDNFFLEPTQELGFVRNLADGAFAVEILPTEVAEIERWQFFSLNASTKLIESCNVERSADGLFNTQGTQFFTCVDHPDVFLPAPGTCPRPSIADQSQPCTKDLIPRLELESSAESALEFSKEGQGVVISPAASPLGASFTIEAWIKEAAGTGMRYIYSRGASKIEDAQGKEVFLRLNNGQYEAGFGLPSEAPVISAPAGGGTDEWVHIALTAHKQGWRLYRDGDEIASRKAPSVDISASGDIVIGARKGGTGLERTFLGVIDEVRIWAFARNQADIRLSRRQRLTGLEAGLTGYWRFDEGGPNPPLDQAAVRSVFDQTASGQKGKAIGARWIQSSAPVGENPGINLNSFSLAGRSVKGGLAARLYYQQEQAITGYDQQPKPVKKAARVMLAIGSQSDADLADRAMAVLDFGVSRAGKLAQIPDLVKLAGAGAAVGSQLTFAEQLRKLSAIQAEVVELGQQVVDLDVRAGVRGKLIPLATSAAAGEHPDLSSLPVDPVSDDLRTGVSALDAAMRAVGPAKDAFDAVIAERASATISLTIKTSKISFPSLKGQAQFGATFFPMSRVFASPYVASFDDSDKLTEISQQEISNSEKNGLLVNVGMKPELAARFNAASTAAQQAQTAVNTGKDALRSLAERWRNEKSQAESDIIPKRALLNAKQVELRKVETALAGFRPIPMPLIHLDPLGLSVAGRILTSVKSDHAPFLYDCSNGNLALYFRAAEDGVFSVAYYDTSLTRAHCDLTAQNGIVVCSMRSSEHLPEETTPGAKDELKIEVGDGSATDSCNITITRGDAKEIWRRVPREASQLEAVLNGAATPVDLGLAQTVGGADGEIRLTAPLARVLSAGDTLLVKQIRATVSRAAAVGDTVIHIEKVVLKASANEPVRLLPYDYAAHADANGAIALLSRGSRLTRISANGASGAVRNQTAGTGSMLPCQWTAEPPGRTLSFLPSVTARRGEVGQTEPFDFSKHLSMEAWVKPDEFGGRGRLITHDATASKYSLGLRRRGDNYTIFAAVERALEKPGSSVSSFSLAESKDTIRRGEWAHVAAVYHQGYAVRFNGIDGFIDCGKDPTLDIARDLTVEVFCERTGTGAQGLLTRGQILEGGDKDVPYVLAFDPDGRVLFGFQSTEHQSHFVATKAKILPASGFHRIAVVRTPHTDTSATPPATSDEIRIFVDGQVQVLLTPADLLEAKAKAAAGDVQKAVTNLVNSLADAGAELLESLKASLSTRPLDNPRLDQLISQSAKAADITNNLSAARSKLAALSLTDIEVRLLLSTISGGFEDGGKLYRYKGRGAGSSSEALHVGRATLPGAGLSHFKGSISEVRIWNRAIEAAGISAEIKGGEKGLVAWLRMREGEGNTTADSKGRNHGVLKGGSDWTLTSDPRGCPLTIYRNGSPVAVDRVSLVDFPFVKSEKLSLGAADETLTDKFQGLLEEVRIWDGERTEEQIQDNMFRRLVGEKENLIAYYTFDLDLDSLVVGKATGLLEGKLTIPAPGLNAALAKNDLVQLRFANPGPDQKPKVDVTVTEAAAVGAQILSVSITQDSKAPDDITIVALTPRVVDQGLRGNTLKAETAPDSATFPFSDAPIGEDAPQIRDALGGLATTFQAAIKGQAAVQEYGDAQTDPEGNLIGVMKRCYSFLQPDGRWNLVTGFKVGNLIAEWVGQVQFAPELKGYIEGAPPVPSENLIQGQGDAAGDSSGYNGAGSVELVMADETTYTYSADRNTGFDVSLELGLKAGVKSETLGGPLVAVTSLEEANVKAGVKSSMEYSQSWARGAEAAVGNTISRKASLTLRGGFEDEASIAALGRRFIPENLGMAVVESETADVFALRLAHNHALVAYQMRPNPDIPKDTNIITFPINPTYTRQGTLDGKLGSKDTDEAYPQALSYSPDSSYFKPIEAYALKNRIKREETELQTFYELNDPVGAVTRTGMVALGGGALTASIVGLGAGIELQLLANELANQAVADLARPYKRNLVNTYVWTADGGLFSETEESMDVFTESSGGAFDFKSKIGGTFEAEGAVSKAAFAVELSASFGGHLNLALKKKKDSKRSYAVNVDLGKVEKNILARNAAGKLVKAEGKVDAYRFLTFLLEPRNDHYDVFFERVVSPEWLRGSSDPGAAALRQARDRGVKSACWRIMHRVTYVSRVLGKAGSGDANDLDNTLQRIGIESNFELIKFLEPFVRGATRELEFAAAVRNAIDKFRPELKAHADTIILYMRLFFGVLDEDGSIEESQGANAGAAVPIAPLTVRAGNDRTVRVGESITLSGDAEGATRLQWTVVSQPPNANVVFATPDQLSTNVVLDQRGVYRLSLTAGNQFRTSSGTVTITANATPRIDAGPDQELQSGAPVSLSGRILDDGRGDPSGPLTIRWIAAQQVTIESGATTLSPTVRGDKPGTYPVLFSVSNGTDTVSDELLLTVSGRVRRGLEALYHFREAGGSVVRDLAGVGIPVDLALKGAAQFEENGLRIRVGGSASTTAAPTRIINAIRSSGQFTAECWIEASGLPDGLGRIVALSNGPGARNFILGQTGGLFYAAARTSTTNLNATNKALSGGTAPPLTLKHVVMTREASGTLRLFVDGHEAAGRTLTGNLANWSDDLRLSLGNEAGSSAPQHAWEGIYHLVAIYSRALTAAEVLRNFQVGADADLPPIAVAGPEQVIDLPATAILAGNALDDRTPAQNLTFAWAQVAGPPAIIANPASRTTSVSFQRPGVHEFRFIVTDDGGLSTSDSVKLHVNGPPEVSVAPHDPIRLTGPQVTVDLKALIRSSGLANPDAPDAPSGFRPVLSWVQKGGPPAPLLQPLPDDIVRVQLNRSGAYSFEVTAKNGRASSTAVGSLQVFSGADVDIGGDRNVAFPGSIRLSATVADNGLVNPNASVNFRWSANPAEGVIFSDATNIATDVELPRSGRYDITLTADNGQVPSTKRINILANQAPAVDAGAPQVTSLSAGAVLDATISDDGLPENPGVLTLKWSKTDGPGFVTFDDDAAVSTIARFSERGIYVLELAASDGDAAAGGLTTRAHTRIAVNSAPQVTIVTPRVNPLGPRLTLAPGQSIPLQAQLDDDGLVEHPLADLAGAVATRWVVTSGAATAVVFSDAATLATDATFSARGRFEITLLADNGFGQTRRSFVAAVHTPPDISAGPDQTVSRSALAAATARLAGVITDDGMPPGSDPPIVRWTQVSGPVPGVFDDPSRLDASVGLTQTGSYEFELSVSNGPHTARDRVTIRVAAAAGA